MKKLICLLTVLIVALSSASALSDPRYPAYGGPILDAASALSADTESDLAAFNELLRKKTDGLQLIVATVDFLDGQAIEDYAFALFERWQLGKNDLLLLLAVGEDRYYPLFGSRSIQLSTVAMNNLLESTFSEPFLAQRYDEAFSALIPALSRELENAYGISLGASGLFEHKQEAVSYSPAETPVWVTEYASMAQNLVELARSTAERTAKWSVFGALWRGFSLPGVIILVIVLLVLRGVRRSGRKAARSAGVASLLFGRKRR